MYQNFRTGTIKAHERFEMRRNLISSDSKASALKQQYFYTNPATQLLLRSKSFKAKSPTQPPNRLKANYYYSFRGYGKSPSRAQNQTQNSTTAPNAATNAFDKPKIHNNETQFLQRKRNRDLPESGLKNPDHGLQTQAVEKPEHFSATERNDQINNAMDKEKESKPKSLPKTRAADANNGPATVTTKSSSKSKPSEKSIAKLKRNGNSDVASKTGNVAQSNRAQKSEMLASTRKTSILNLFNNSKIRLSVEEAAAKLSFPWPTPASIKDANSKVESNSKSSVSVSKREKILKEIAEFLRKHPQLLNEFGPARKNMIKTRDPVELELNDSLEAVLEALHLAFMQNGMYSSSLRKNDKFTRVRIPKWNEVETNWPWRQTGFGKQEPVRNWMDYSKPSKITGGLLGSENNKNGKRQKIAWDETARVVVANKN